MKFKIPVSGRSRQDSKFKYAIAILIILCTLVICAGQARAGQQSEKTFTYYLYWSGIRAGTAIMKYKSTPEGVTISTHATSTSFISFFYKVDDRAHSILYPDGYPKYYSLKIHEGRTRKEKSAHFERIKEGASQKIIYKDVLKGETTEFYPEKPVYGPLSGFYELTKRALIVGESNYIDVFDSKKFLNTEVKVLRKEKINVRAGEFDTIVVSPLLKTEGIFLKKGAMHIWLTDDKEKIPVLFKSKVKIGSFTAKLAKIE